MRGKCRVRDPFVNLIVRNRRITDFDFSQLLSIDATDEKNEEENNRGFQHG
jgi:hypothetical protein